MFSSFIPSRSFNRLFTKINSSWLIYKPVKALQVKISLLFKLVFDKKKYYFIMFFLLYNCCSNRIAELVIPIKIPTKEAKEEIETHPFFSETNIQKCSV